jgi:hypothetical protein
MAIVKSAHKKASPKNMATHTREKKKHRKRLSVMPDLAGPDDRGLAEVGDVGGEVPVEVPALQPLTQLHAAAHVAVGSNILLLEIPALQSYVNKTGRDQWMRK